MPFMTQVGDIPTQSTKSAVMTKFKGVDLTGDVTTMDASRCPMTRASPPSARATAPACS